MKKLQITEVFSQTYDSQTKLIHEQIKITNVSTDYINNLKLIIDDKDHALLEQLVTRQRGSLSFSPSTTCLELGNLAPEESAYFEYKYNATTNTAFSSNISLTYNETDLTLIPKKKLTDFLSPNPEPEETPSKSD